MEIKKQLKAVFFISKSKPCYLASTFLVAGFLATGFLAVIFLTAGFLATVFLAGAFLANVFLPPVLPVTSSFAAFSASNPSGEGRVEIFAGRYGSYVQHAKIRATIPKSIEPESLTID